MAMKLQNYTQGAKLLVYVALTKDVFLQLLTLQKVMLHDRAVVTAVLGCVTT